MRPVRLQTSDMRNGCHPPTRVCDACRTFPTLTTILRTRSDPGSGSRCCTAWPLPHGHRSKARSHTFVRPYSCVVRSTHRCGRRPSRSSPRRSRRTPIPVGVAHSPDERPSSLTRWEPDREPGSRIGDRMTARATNAPNSDQRPPQRCVSKRSKCSVSSRRVRLRERPRHPGRREVAAIDRCDVIRAETFGDRDDGCAARSERLRRQTTCPRHRRGVVPE